MRLLRSLGVLLALGIAATVLRTAWLSDDAFIIARVADNFVSGHGLRWNVIDRVQVFTCPLWALLLIPLYAATGGAMTSLWALSFSSTGVLLGLFLRRLRERPARVLGALALLASSQAFLDFSTSGLENPLSHALVAAFVLSLPGTCRGEMPGAAPSASALVLPTALIALLMANRLDLVVVAGPAFLVAAIGTIRSSGGRVLRPAARAMLPLLLWHSFALLYYGTPWPNTAWAKLGHGAPREVLARNGGAWLDDALQHDPQSLLGPACVAAFLILRGPATARALGLGLLAQGFYVWWVGGDFMRGRFLSVPVVVAAAALVHFLPGRTALGIGAVALVSATLAGRGFVTPTFLPRTPNPGLVGDERAVWSTSTGLFSSRREAGRFQQPAWQWRDSERGVIRETVIGARAWDGGPGLQVVDEMALADAFLARVPVGDPRMIGARPGHFIRPIPEGYLESVEDGVNRLVDPRYHARFDDILLITRSPLWSRGRAAAIWRWNLRTGVWAPQPTGSAP